MPQLSPLPWMLSIVTLAVMAYILKVLMWYSASSSLKFSKST